MKVVLDARLRAGVPGGIQQIILGAAVGLADLDDDCSDDFAFLVIAHEDGWIRGFIRPPCRVVDTPQEPVRGFMERVVRRAGRFARSDRGGPPIDDVLEQSGADVVHMLRQNALTTSRPSIYHPYDLQHLHVPAFFSEREVAAREHLYRGHCDAASIVVMMTAWSKADLCARYGLPASKVAVVAPAPFVRLLGRPEPGRTERLRAGLGIPGRFALYPAQTWPHKNHVNLLKALALLRSDRNLVVPLVCCGTQNTFFGHVHRAMEDLGLKDQVRFVGWLDDDDVHALYRSAHCLVFPSHFEGWGMPVTEAFEVGLPVACTDAAWLPEVMRGAVLGFDPMDPLSIADALAMVWQDDETRAGLVEEGGRRANTLSWKTSAATFRAMYRSITDLPLTGEDHRLLSDAGIAPQDVS